MNEAGNRFALRNLTRSDHERLDALVGTFGDGRSYIRYLESMAAFRRPLEKALSRVDLSEHFGAWRPGLIGPELTQDLRDLGLDDVADGAEFPLPAERDGLMGVLYVLEGSALGARVLVRRAAALGFTAQHGARHLAAQTARPQAWPQFVTLLDAISDEDMQRAAAAARVTFSAAINAFGGIDARERAC